MADNKLHKGHRERLRQRFTETGFNGFQPHEILELLLFYSIPRVNTNETAHRLLDKFGGLYEVMEAEESELSEVKGISSNSAMFIKICRDICRYYLMTEMSVQKTDNLIEYIKNYFQKMQTEIYLILSIDSSQNIRSVHTFPSDIFSEEKINARLIAETILRSKMHRITIARNHIERIAVPDDEDYYAVKNIGEILAPLRVKIEDYIITDGNIVFSMREKGAFSFE